MKSLQAFFFAAIWAFAMPFSFLSATASAEVSPSFEGLEAAFQATQACDLFLAVGTSLVVHPAAQLPVNAVRYRAELVILNGQETPLDSLASTVIRTPLAQTFSGFGEEIDQNL